MAWGKPVHGQTETSTGFDKVTFKDKTDSSGNTTDTIVSRGWSRDVPADHGHAWNQDTPSQAGHRNDTSGVFNDGGYASESPRK
jgi:hypothetical protein